ncbi:MAG: hypothetical protein ABUM51_07500, partial [Bacteroidota bacterium]
MKNLDNEVWEFLQDDRFIKWVHSPDEGAIAYWEGWMEQHPDKVTTLFKAREIARDLAYMEKPAGAEILSAGIWAEVMSQLGEESPEIIAQPEIKPIRNRRIWYAAAACLAGLLLIGAGFFRYRSVNHPSVVGPQQVANLLGKEG